MKELETVARRPASRLRPVVLTALSGAVALALVPGGGATARVALRGASQGSAAPLRFATGRRISTAGLATVSCGSPRSCFALDFRGRAYRFTGSRWSAATSIAPRAAGPGRVSLSCGAADLCAAAPSRSDQVAVWGGRSWSSASSLLDALGIEAVGCSPGGYCATVDARGNAFAFAGRGWTRTGGDWGSVAGISCVTASFCASVGPSGISLWNGGGWSFPNAYGASTPFAAVSCVTTTFCAAVDSGGEVLWWDGRSWSHPARIEPRSTSFTSLGAAPTGISCPDTGFCAVSDDSGAILQWEAEHWRRTVPAGRHALTAISCPSRSFCVAAQSYGAVLVGRAG